MCGWAHHGLHSAHGNHIAVDIMHVLCRQVLHKSMVHCLHDPTELLKQDA